MEIARMKHLRLLLLLGLLTVLGHAPQALAVCQSAASGSWNTGSTWTGCAGTGGIPAATDVVTINAHHVITVNANASARSFSLVASTTPANGITISGSNSLIFTNDCTLNGGTTAGGTQTVSIGTGTMQCGSLSIVGSSGAGSLVSLSSGTLTLTIAGSPATTGTITFSGTAANAQLVSTGASTINIAGSLSAGGTLTPSAGTINFNGAGAQTIAVYTYNNVVINKTAGTATVAAGTPSATFNGTFTMTAGTLTGTGSIVAGGAFNMNGGTATLSGGNNIMFGGLNMNGGALTIGGLLQSYIADSMTGGTMTVNSSWVGHATLTMSGGTMTVGSAGDLIFLGAATVNGTINVAGGFDFLSTLTVGGTMALTGTQANTVTGLLTISPGGKWSNTNSPVTFEGGITNNGTFNGGTGIQTFNTNSQTLSGSGSILFSGSVYVVGAITVTNNATVGVAILGGGVASGTTGIWRQGTSGNLFVSTSLFPPNTPAGSTISPTFDGTAVGNIVTYNGAAQTVNLAPSYYNLSLSGSGIKTLGTATGQTLTMAGGLGLLNGVTFLGSTFNPTINIGGAVTNLGTITTGNGTVTIGGSFSNLNLLGGGFTTTGTGTFSLAGNFSNAGTFTTGTGTIIFNGTTAQTFTGTNAAGSTTFNSMQLNNAAGLTMIGTHNLIVGTPSPIAGTCPTVAAVQPVVLTLTSGQITTGSNTLTIGNGSAIASAGGSNFVVGNLIKPFSAGASETRVFEVGTGTSYAPVTFFFSCVATSANVTVSTAGSDHPQIATSSIDSYQSLNRYWTMSVVSAHSGWFTVAASNTVTFGFVAADVDPPPTATAGFVVETYTASGWSAAIAPTGAGATSTTIAISSLSASALSAAPAGFQIGDAGASIPPPAAFNAFEHSTPATSTSGYIYTKVAGDPISGAYNTGIDIVALDSTGALLTGFTGTVQVALIASTIIGPAPAAVCPTTGFTPIASVNATFSTANLGRVNVSLPAPANVWRDVRVQITYAGPPSISVCGTDRFAIRPYYLATKAQDQDWNADGIARTLNNAGASGGVVHKATVPFTVSVSAAATTGNLVSQYAGTAPTIKSGSPICTLPTSNCTLGVLSALSFPAAAGGMASVSSVQYGEAGAFSLELEDQTFAMVDATDIGIGTAYIIPQTISPLGTAAPATFGPITVGRFVPDHFAIAANAPVLYTFNSNYLTCPLASKSFTYLGQPLTFLTSPNLTITAQTPGNLTTTNYNGALWKLPNTSAVPGKNCVNNPDADTCVFTNTAGSGASSTLTYTYTVSSGSKPNWDNNQVVPATQLMMDNGNGTGTLSYVPGTSDIFAFTRNSSLPQGKFNATITLTPSVTDPSDAGGTGVGASIVTSAPPAVGVTFDSGNEFRYGRLHVSNAGGSELLPLLSGVQAQYYVPAGATSGVFVTNTSDNCTPVSAVNIGRGNFPPGNLNLALTSPTIVKTDGVTPTSVLSGGQAVIRFPAPGAGKNGAMDIVLNLENASGPSTCVAISGVAGTPGANLLYLQDVQSCSGGQYIKDPTAHITFGVYNVNPNAIFLRENY
jgi:hypothetical protein